MRVVKEEQSRLSAWKRELETLEEKSKTETESLERQRRQLNADRQKLDQLAQQVRDKSAEIDDLVAVINETESKLIYFVCRTVCVLVCDRRLAMDSLGDI